jgi:hypothetical protein
LEITGQVTTKSAMSTALGNVKTAQAALTKAIQECNVVNLGVVSGALDDLQDDVTDFSNDLTLMLYEANSLSSNWDIITGKYNTLLSLAGTLSISTTVLTNAYNALHSELDTTWLGQVYPKTLVSGDRTRLSGLLIDYNEEETTIVNAINAEQSIVSFDDGFDASQFKLIYDGLIRGFTPELELVYVSENELSLKPNYSDFEYLTVNEQNIQASKRTSIFTQTPVLAWDENTSSLSQSVLAAETEYYVYLANRSIGFKIESGTTPYDYRGKLFCSGTEPSNNYLGESGLGLNAIYVGNAETNASIKFIHELDVSIISRVADSKETFREFSDFDLIFVDEDTLRLQKTYGLYGQMYIPESLYYIGDDREVYTSSLRIELDSQLNLVFDDSAIAADTTYYIYLAGDIDIYNNNAVNNATNRPWHPEDTGNPSLYDADKDLRLYMFLSTQVPDNGRLDESYKGFWTRYIGTIQTDANGKFKYANNISAIRQPTLNPTDLDGMANISLLPVSSTSFKIIRKKGTNGAVYVGGIPIYTLDEDNPDAHTLNITAETKDYDEGTPLAPLSDSGTVVNTVVSDNIYVYLSNDRDFWGDTASCLFWSLDEPTGGYLSQNWPGNNARWLCTFKLAPATYGSNLVTNGTFASNSDWTWGSGWSFDNNDKKAFHSTPSGTAALSQGITAVAGGYYELVVSVRDRNVGGVVASFGGTDGENLWANTSKRQYIIATTTGGLYFTPNGGFDGSIDTVTCKRVSTGQLTGSYVVDSVGFGSASLNDAVVSYNEGWSSAKIMEELNKLATQFGLSQDSSEQNNAGLPLLLEYYSSTQVSIKCTAALPVIVVFPDLTTLEITSDKFLGTVTGSANTLYYVYLDKDGLSVSTTEPDGVYTGRQTLGDTKVLVGYLGFSATNTLAGEWNVYSFWNQSTREWNLTSINKPSAMYITGCDSYNWPTVNNSSVATTNYSIYGVVVPPGVIPTFSFSGLSCYTWQQGNESDTSDRTQSLGTITSSSSDIQVYFWVYYYGWFFGSGTVGFCGQGGSSSDSVYGYVDAVTSPTSMSAGHVYGTSSSPIGISLQVRCKDRINTFIGSLHICRFRALVLLL